jgi:hypothetical protein
VSFARLCSLGKLEEGRSGMRRCIGLDVHREFAQVAIWEDGVVRQAGRIELTPEGLRDFAASLCATGEVALEATGNTHPGRAAAGAPRRPGGGLQSAEDPGDRRGQGHHRKVDAAVLAGLLAANYLPSVWLPDDQTHALRRQVTRRAHIVRQRTRLQEPGAVDPPAATWCPAARPPTCSAPRAGRGWPPRTSQQTSTRQSGHCCASLTFTPLSCASSTPNSAGPPWSAPRSAGC